jgi:hypothetical protein
MMIIVKVDLAQKIPQDVDPFPEWNLAENIVVPGIKAKSKSRRIDFLEKQEQGSRIFLEDVFDGQAKSHGSGFLDQGSPGLEAAFEPEVYVSIKFPSFVTGMKDDVLRLEKCGQFEDLRKTVRGNLLDSPVHASGAEIHEGTVKSDLQSVIAEGPGQSFRFPFMAGIEIIAGEIDLRVNAILNGKTEPLQKRRIGDVDLDGGHAFFDISPNGQV